MHSVKRIPLVVLTALAGCVSTAAHADVKLMAELATPKVMAEQSTKAFLKVGLRGADLREKRQRTPVNIAIVLDKSSSMGGDKIVEARRAAVMTIESLDPNDIVSVITYDSTVRVVVPATRAAGKEEIIAAIERITPSGMTALFAGVSKGAAELRKFFDANRVNRVILLSDGMANVGPSSPGELEELGASLGREGITVTTLGLGLGYNEDLMFKLAMASDGNHAFVENATELARIFKAEFGDVFSVVAQNVDVRIECAPGVKPLRVLGRRAEIRGNIITAHLNQLYGGQEKYLLVEIELPALRIGQQRKVVDVGVTFANMQTKQKGRLTTAAIVASTSSQKTIDAHTNKEVMIEAVALLANEQSKIVMALRDEGKVEKARDVLRMNEAFLRSNAVRYRSKKLKKIEVRNKESAENLDEEKWNRTRKQMRKYDFEDSMQQSY